MNGIFESTVIRALGYTLFHSLWQFSIIAMLMYGVHLRLKLAKSRYLAGMIAMCLMLVSAFATFCMYSASTLSEYPIQTHAVFDAGRLTAKYGTDATHQLGLQAHLPLWVKTQWIDIWAPYLVIAWLMGLLLFFFRFGAGFWGLLRLKKWAQPLITQHWMSTLQDLKGKLGIQTPVALMESAFVHSPIVLGWIKPVILMPIGLFNQLSVQEIEAVLAHELAHIARQDWIVNLLQTIIESIFYYHPAVWWISSTVRQEREKCCDDIALQMTQNRLCYAKTLLRIQELATPVSSVGLVLGMDGGDAALHPDKRRMFLLERIRRILNQPQPTSFNMGKFMAMLLLLALLLTGIFRANTAPFSTTGVLNATQEDLPEFIKTPTNVLSAAVTLPDSVPKGKKNRSIQRVYREEDDGKKVELEAQDGKITKLVIEGKVIPESEYEQHKDLTNSLLNSTPPPPPPPPAAPEAPDFRYYPGYPPPPPPPAAPAAPRAPKRGWPGHDNRQGYEEYPAPPARSGSDKMWIEEDANGHKTIRVYGDEGSTDITITNDEVFINGEKVENGQVYDLHGNVMRFHNGQFEGGFWENRDAEAPAVFFKHGTEELRAYAPEAYPEQLMALSELRRPLMSVEQLEQLEKELKAAERSLE